MDEDVDLKYLALVEEFARFRAETAGREREAALRAEERERRYEIDRAEAFRTFAQIDRLGAVVESMAEALEVVSAQLHAVSAGGRQCLLQTPSESQENLPGLVGDIGISQERRLPRPAGDFEGQIAEMNR